MILLTKGNSSVLELRCLNFLNEQEQCCLETGIKGGIKCSINAGKVPHESSRIHSHDRL